MKFTEFQVITILIIFIPLLSGCESMPRSVVAATGTNIGLEISQNPATQAPQMKLGYNRGEVALVGEKAYDDDVANVLMELRYGGSDDTHPGIYQRLAVGRTAVKQSGASFMFLKNPDGTFPSATAIQNANEAHKAFSGDD